MRMPALDDTIIAVSSAWQESAIGIIRLSGSAALALSDQLAQANEHVADSCAMFPAKLAVGGSPAVPATVLRFRAPHSYTGQDLVEWHTVGCLPVLRALCAHAIELGARRALPGEFTARAFLNARLDARQVDGVFDLIHARDRSAARAAARLQSNAFDDPLRSAGDTLIDLIARLEAGIDFADEDDVRFITAAELREAVETLIETLAALDAADTEESRRALPHIALAGLPNAGKSTLFNALVGTDRAIVSPVIGTTRDVLSTEITLQGVSAILQDCAGLGASNDEIALMAHRAAERAEELADLIVWVHDSSKHWAKSEIRACRRAPDARRILVQSKRDLAAPDCVAGLAFRSTVEVSAFDPESMLRFETALADELGQLDTGGRTPSRAAHLSRARAALDRTLALLGSGEPQELELLALELRDARGELAGGTTPIEAVLGRIYSHFCVGK